jgi:hypothetical protein
VADTPAGAGQDDGGTVRHGLQCSATDPAPPASRAFLSHGCGATVPGGPPSERMDAGRRCPGGPPSEGIAAAMSHVRSDQSGKIYLLLTLLGIHSPEEDTNPKETRVSGLTDRARLRPRRHLLQPRYF